MTMPPSQLQEADASAALDAAAASLPPSGWSNGGRGIVIPGGGARYFPSAWVCIRTLRAVGCTLPIELWHAGQAELDAEMRWLVEPFGVRCVDAEEVARRHPVRFLQGWPLKAYALLHSRFREVLLLDADNMPLVDPAFLFELPAYARHGAVFWPDHGAIGPRHPIWRLTGLQYRDEPPVESAQLLVDKAVCSSALALAVWMNCQHGDFWYQHIYGDKDTFHFAWRKLGIDYAMPSRPLRRLPCTMIQHDFEGRPIFQHRHGNKWTLDSQILRIRGFRWEDQCLGYLAELRRTWGRRPCRPYQQQHAGPSARAIAQGLTESDWSLNHDGSSAVIRFTGDGRVYGAGPREQEWALHVHESEALLSISGIESVAWVLARGDADLWVGQAPAEPGRHVEMRRLKRKLRALSISTSRQKRPRLRRFRAIARPEP
jgi:hypothetical protein